MSDDTILDLKNIAISLCIGSILSMIIAWMVIC